MFGREGLAGGADVKPVFEVNRERVADVGHSRGALGAFADDEVGDGVHRPKHLRAGFLVDAAFLLIALFDLFFLLCLFFLLAINTVCHQSFQGTSP